MNQEGIMGIGSERHKADITWEAIITFGNGWLKFDDGQDIYLSKAMMPLRPLIISNQVSINNDVIHGHRGTTLRMNDLTQMFKESSKTYDEVESLP